MSGLVAVEWLPGPRRPRCKAGCGRLAQVEVSDGALICVPCCAECGVLVTQRLRERYERWLERGLERLREVAG